MKRLLHWAVLAFVLHGLWEAMQLPLYTLWEDSDRRRILSYLIHCIAGDILIATILFLLIAALFRDFVWPLHRPWRAGAMMVATGLAYTVFSEWYNVYRVGAWAYTASMPLVAGIGLTPLMQWVAVPILMIIVIRRWR
ncbi:MAG: hypothetical protein HY274_01770 [Gammaproteobacteria bacterium]|nr:hypothetical protein [Gammaproteobacteria bacterium]